MELLLVQILEIISIIFGDKNRLPGDQDRVPNARNGLSEVQTLVPKAQNRDKVESWRPNILHPTPEIESMRSKIDIIKS